MNSPQRAARRLRRGVAVGLLAPRRVAGDEEEGEPSDDELPVIPWAEIMQHRFLADIWVVVDGKVYDMTEFIASDTHPGGEEIPLQYAGKDATEVRPPPSAGRRCCFA